MKTSREHKRLVAIGRRTRGKKNGVIPAYWFDQAAFIWKHSERKRRTLASLAQREAGLQ